MDREQMIARAKEHLGKLLESQFARIDKMKETQDFIDFSTLHPLVIVIVGGDGIGLYNGGSTKSAGVSSQDELSEGKAAFRVIDGLTIENRAKQGKAIPDDVLEELKSAM